MAINPNKYVRPVQVLPGQALPTSTEDAQARRVFKGLRELAEKKIESGVVNQTVGAGFTVTQTGDQDSLALTQIGTSGWTGVRLRIGSGAGGAAGAGWEISLLDTNDPSDAGGNALAFADLMHSPKRRRLVLDHDGQLRIETAQMHVGLLNAVNNNFVLQATSGVGAVSAGFGVGIQCIIADSAGGNNLDAGFLNLATTSVTPSAMSTQWDFYNKNAGTAQHVLAMQPSGDVKVLVGKLLANAGLAIGNSAVGSTLGTVIKKMEVFNMAGSSLGFVPIYDTIT